MMKAKIIAAMRAGSISGRTFTIHVGNGYIDTSRNTARGLADVAICAELIGRNCYIRFAGGQMEQVLDDMAVVSYIPTPAKVQSTVDALRALGVCGRITVCAEYEEGYEAEIYEA
jgi:hypothetical protein